MNKIINFLPCVLDILEEKNITVKPTVINAIDNESCLDYLKYEILAENYSLFGTGSLGGLAYFGLTKDIKKIQVQAYLYLENMDTSDIYNQMYFLWNMGEYSLLLLHENYQEEVNNPYPSNANVMFLYFGGWISDYTLPTILNFSSKERSIHAAEWLVGKVAFSESDKEHMLMLSKFKKIVKEIAPNIE